MFAEKFYKQNKYVFWQGRVYQRIAGFQPSEIKMVYIVKKCK